jgi:hypothetical protein
MTSKKHGDRVDTSKGLHILQQAEYKPGDQPPEGYLAWHEWAEAQHKAGLRAKQCGRCGLWRYPQELSPTIDSAELKHMRKGKIAQVTVVTPVCNTCNKPTTQPSNAAAQTHTRS